VKSPRAPIQRASLALAASVALASPSAAQLAAPPLTTPVIDPTGAIAAAALAATTGLQWHALDGHLHTDHSHDAGFFHQQVGKRPENHDTFVAGQLRGAEVMGQELGVLTDHRTYDQHYDPDYRSDTLVLLGGEEWGGYPHATVWGLDEVLEQGPDEGVCGVARAVAEAHAEDAVMGIAHPNDGRQPCISAATLADVPLDHLEALREPHPSFWRENLTAGRRFTPATGSDNHFHQLFPTPAGAGGNTTYVLASAKSEAAFLDGVRRGRTQATTYALSPVVTTVLDADLDGTFDAVTGGFAVPSGGQVRVAFRIERGTGLWLQVFGLVGGEHAIVAETPIALPDQTLAYDLPASSPFYYAWIVAEPAAQVSGQTLDGNLAYADTVRVMSAPVFLTAPAPVTGGTQATTSGSPVALSRAPWAGHPAVAASGGAVHAVWQQRAVPVYEVGYSRSTDGGTTWSAPVILSAAGDARTPAIGAAGDRVVVAWEDHPGSRHGGVITVRTSTDGGASFGPAETLNDPTVPGARPAIALSGEVDHLVWMSMEDGYKIRYARRNAGAWSSPRRLSSAEAYDGLPLTFVVPPRKIRHVPAAIQPVVAASGDRVTVAWEDDREDPTPLRNGTPDDWGIYAAFSTNGGETWSADRRITPRHDATPVNPGDPEKMTGNPARHASLVYGSPGFLTLAYDDPYGSGGANVYVQRSTDDGTTWSAPVAASVVTSELAYRPALLAADGGTLGVVWQASQGRKWSLRRAVSSNGGETFSPEDAFTSGTGYAGFPRAAGGVVVWTGEEAGTYRIFAAPAAPF
jgi:hypothetical protein